MTKPIHLRASLIALNGAEPPASVHLLPIGPKVAGRDGRSWTLDAPALVAAFNAAGHPVPIDWEHAQHIAAPQGREAPASGWIESLSLDADGVWGAVEWTDRAKAAIAAREYRFISPAFEHAGGIITRLVGAGLVNRPNLDLAALNQESSSMDKEFVKALGLPETATAAEALVALNALKAGRVATGTSPSLTEFVPRADFALALNRAEAAEAQIAKITRDIAEAEIALAVDGALKAGKISPASKDYHLAACRVEGGLVAFRAYVAGAPSLFSGAALDEAAKSVAGGTLALNAEERLIAKAMGINPADLIKHKAALAALGETVLFLGDIT